MPRHSEPDLIPGVLSRKDLDISNVFGGAVSGAKRVFNITTSDPEGARGVISSLVPFLKGSPAVNAFSRAVRTGMLKTFGGKKLFKQELGEPSIPGLFGPEPRTRGVKKSKSQIERERKLTERAKKFPKTFKKSSLDLRNPPAVRSTPRQDAILETLGKTDKPLTRSEILNRADIKVSSAGPIFRTLLKEGKITVNQGLYSLNKDQTAFQQATPSERLQLPEKAQRNIRESDQIFGIGSVGAARVPEQFRLADVDRRVLVNALKNRTSAGTRGFIFPEEVSDEDLQKFSSSELELFRRRVSTNLSQSMELGRPNIQLSQKLDEIARIAKSKGFNLGKREGLVTESPEVELESFEAADLRAKPTSGMDLHDSAIIPSILQKIGPADSGDFFTDLGNADVGSLQKLNTSELEALLKRTEVENEIIAERFEAALIGADVGEELASQFLFTKEPKGKKRSIAQLDLSSDMRNTEVFRDMQTGQRWAKIIGNILRDRRSGNGGSSPRTPITPRTPEFTN